MTATQRLALARQALLRLMWQARIAVIERQLAEQRGTRP